MFTRKEERKGSQEEKKQREKERKKAQIEATTHTQHRLKPPSWTRVINFTTDTERAKPRLPRVQHENKANEYANEARGVCRPRGPLRTIGQPLWSSMMSPFISRST